MIKKILDTARGEIGYHEGAGNDNKYGVEYGMNGQPWCVIFQWWCFKHSGAGDLFPATAHCDGVRKYAKGIGRWIDAAKLLLTEGIKAGDIVIWDYDNDGSGDHIGIIEKVTGRETFTTIEGNYADGVCRVSRNLAGVSGIYRPAYEEGEGEEMSKNENKDELLTLGSRGYRVRVIQAVLMLNGFNLGSCGIDGEFGEMTAKAVKGFQSRHGLECDGIVGRETLSAMWKEEN